MNNLLDLRNVFKNKISEILSPFHNVHTYEELNKLLEPTMNLINKKNHNFIRYYFVYCLIYQKFGMNPKKSFIEIENKMSKIEKEYLDQFKKKYFSKISIDEYEEVKDIGLVKDSDSHNQMKQDIQNKNLEPFYKNFISGMYSNSNLKISTFMELDFTYLNLKYIVEDKSAKCLCGHTIKNVHHVVSKNRYKTKRMKSPDHIILKIGNCCIERFVDGGASYTRTCYKCFKNLKDEDSGRNKNYKHVDDLILCNDCYSKEEKCFVCGIITSSDSHNEFFCKNKYKTETNMKTKLFKLREKEGNVCMFKGCYQFCKKGEKCQIHNKEYQCKLCLIEINPRQYGFGQKCFDCNKKNKELSKKCKCGKIITHPKFYKCYNCYIESNGPSGPR